MSYQVFFIFKHDEYLTKDKTWSQNRNDTELMSEQEASDTCQDYDKSAGCGSMIVKEQ
jgi:hypothetical protein